MYFYRNVISTALGYMYKKMNNGRMGTVRLINATFPNDTIYSVADLETGPAPPPPFRPKFTIKC
jgi:hypothetical protein